MFFKFTHTKTKKRKQHVEKYESHAHDKDSIYSKYFSHFFQFVEDYAQVKSHAHVW